MATINTTLAWDTTLDRWLLSMSQNSQATDNLGIPTSPYVKKLYISLKSIREHFAPLFLQGSGTVNGTELENYIQNNSVFVRVSEKSDLELPTASTLGSELATKLTKDWYGTDHISTIEGGTSTFTAYEIPFDPEQEERELTSTGFLDDKKDYLLRTDSTEHLSLEGWVYFKDSSLVAEEFFTYDEAKKIKDMVEHRLEWMTKTETTTTYLPLSAGVASISPPRKPNLPNSASVAGICAGDIVRIVISGGSGDYSITAPDKFNEVGFHTYRFVENEASTFSFVVRDTTLNISVTVSVQTEEKT